MKVLTELSICGVNGLEVRGLDGEMDAEKISWFAPENMAETQKLMDRFGLKWAGFGTSANFHDEKTCAANVAAAKRAIDICQRMGIPAIRVFGDQIKDPAQRDAIVQRVIAALKDLSDRRGLGGGRSPAHGATVPAVPEMATANRTGNTTVKRTGHRTADEIIEKSQISA